MKILLVMLHNNAKRNFFARVTYPSLTLQQIAAITPREHTVEIVDERFERLEKEGRITSYDWSRYTEGNVNFKPKRMSEEELLEGMRGTAGDFYSVKSSFKRSFNKHNLDPFKSIIKFIINMINRSFYKKEKLGI